MVSIASDSDAIREPVSDVSTPATHRAEESWHFLWLQWFVRCELSQTEDTSEFLVFPIMPEEVKELPGCTASGTGKIGVYVLFVVDGLGSFFSIKHLISPPFHSRLVVSLEGITPFLVNCPEWWSYSDSMITRICLSINSQKGCFVAKEPQSSRRSYY